MVSTALRLLLLLSSSSPLSLQNETIRALRRVVEDNASLRSEVSELRRLVLEATMTTTTATAAMTGNTDAAVASPAAAVVAVALRSTVSMTVTAATTTTTTTTTTASATRSTPSSSALLLTAATERNKAQLPAASDVVRVLRNIVPFGTSGSDSDSDTSVVPNSVNSDKPVPRKGAARARGNSVPAPPSLYRLRSQDNASTKA